MKEQLIDFQTAQLAKEKGFKEKVYACYKNPTERGREFYKDGTLDYSGSDYDPESYEDLIIDYNSIVSNYYCDKEYFSAPTQSLLQKWLREVHKLHIIITVQRDMDANDNYYCEIHNLTEQFDTNWKAKKYEAHDISTCCETYENALEEGLLEALTLTK